MQVKLLRVLQERQRAPGGRNQRIPVDVRVIAATNRDLDKQVQRALSREDLLLSLSVIPIRVPGLRSGAEDISLLANHFLKSTAPAAGKSFTASRKRRLMRSAASDWPGNVRQLENTIERAWLWNRAANASGTSSGASESARRGGWC